jgi:invasion protein IalB
VKMKSVLAGAFFASLVFAAGNVNAQAPDATPATPGRPEVKTVGDWLVRCFPVNSPNPCDIFQELADQSSRQRILSVSIAYMPSMDRHLLQVTVPLDIAIQKGMTIQTDSYKSPVLKYRMCSRDGCFVQMAADNAMVEALAKSGPESKVNIVGDNGKAYAIKLSLKGFSAAHDEMVSQARVKAKPAKTGDAAAPATP